MSPEARLF